MINYYFQLNTTYDHLSIRSIKIVITNIIIIMNGHILVTRAKDCPPCIAFSGGWDPFVKELFSKAPDFVGRIHNFYTVSIKEPIQSADPKYAGPMNWVDPIKGNNMPAMYYYTDEQWDKGCKGEACYKQDVNLKIIANIVNSKTPFKGLRDEFARLSKLPEPKAPTIEPKNLSYTSPHPPPPISKIEPPKEEESKMDNNPFLLELKEEDTCSVPFNYTSFRTK